MDSSELILVGFSLSVKKKKQDSQPPKKWWEE
jgi:hypothetical protein